MNFKKLLAGFLATVAALRFCACGKAQVLEQTETTTESESTVNTDNLIDENRITPEQLGISSADITALIEGLKNANLAMHSVLIMKDSQIVAEAYADGYDENTLQRMYSVSKSFVGIAIGVLADEGKISLDDKVCDYFKDIPKYSSAVANADSKIKAATIKDLLKMTSPYQSGGASYKDDNDVDWVMTFFTNPHNRTLVNSGTQYMYDTSATHLLGALVEEVTGMDFLEYLQDKALNEIGFSKNAWCVNSPEGYAWGGSGVMCTTRDLASFANLVMHKGEYNGKQLLPKEYVQNAIKKQTENGVEGNTTFYGQGYGYQIWVTSHTEESFAFLGMGDQLAICIPEKDLIFVCTADNQGMSNSRVKIFELFENNILAKLSDMPLPENSEALVKMDAAIADMKLPVQKGINYSTYMDKINGVTFTNTSNSKISSFTLTFTDETGTLKYTTPRGEKELSFGIGTNVACTLNEPQYSGETITVANGEGYDCVCSAAWSNYNTFVIYVQVVDDYLGNMRLTFDIESNNKIKLTGTKTAEWFLDEYVISGVIYN